MPLAQGIKLGPYEILTPLGSGGMGEVYRARDSRLGRDVAVKVLPHSFAKDRERLQRFEHEARAAGALSHPNVVAVFDVGATDGIPYLVSELLEGESLGNLIRRGPLQPRRAVELMIQAASGLAAAHAKGIVHRDLKPENLFVLPDGRLKILDFGLAKLLRDDAPPRDETGPQLHTLTQTGQIMGTASYMAPEQVRDQPVDYRADLFALGAILHELITGVKAFPGETPADRMTAILTKEPAEWDGSVDLAAPGLALIARRCLEKRADRRFASARDLELALQVVEAGMDARRLAPRVAAETDEGVVAAPSRLRTEYRFRRITFQEGQISRARFASDGQTVVYSASWDGGPPQIYLSRVGSVESRPLGVTDADVLAVSRRDEIAALMRPKDIGAFVVLGTLARVPLIGGVPREMLDRVICADWSPDGRSLLVLRDVDGRHRLEYPVGTVLREADGWMSDPRMSPDGTMIAFREHPVRGNNGGYLKVIDLKNQVITESKYFWTAWRHAWDPSGRAIWFTAAATGRSPGVFRMPLDGPAEPMYQAPTFTTVEDISPRSDLLIQSVVPRMRMQLGSKESSDSRDLSWLDWSLIRDISSDGEWILFSESGITGGEPGVYIRRLDGSPAIRLGDGDCWRLSPDFKWVLTTQSERHDDFALLPIGIGPVVPLPSFGLRCSNAAWFPDGKGFITLATDETGGARLYWYDLETKTARRIRDELFHQIARISPDGREILALDHDRRLVIVATDGSSIRRVGPAVESRRGIGWNREGTHFFTFDKGSIPAPVFLVDAKTGDETLWLEVHPRERSGVDDVNNVCLTPDGMTYAACYPQTLCGLYVMEEVS
jgi:Tol biopolymer transport system component